MLAVCSACTSVQAPSARYSADVELPAGPGREILEAECLICHELTALELFSSFYDRDDWRSLVMSMRSNGAEVDDLQVEVVSDYLAQHFGTGTR